MDNDNASQSEYPALSAVNAHLASPKCGVTRTVTGRILEVQTGIDFPFPMGGHFRNGQPTNARGSVTPNARTPNDNKKGRRDVTYTPLPELDLPLPYLFGENDHNQRSPFSFPHGDNLFYDKTLNQLVVPLERSVNPFTQVVTTRFKMIGPIKASSKNLTLHEQIKSPVQQKRSEKVCYLLKKINFFKAQNSAEANNEESVDRMEFLQAAVPKESRQKFKIKKGEKKGRKGRSKFLLSKLPKIFCFCKKSNCKKEYCNCFKNKVGCNSKCGCSDCNNDTEFHEHTKKSQGPVSPMVSRFSRHAEEQEDLQIEGSEEVGSPEPSQPTRGCNCRKSYCQKKYCDCFSQGRKCGPSCHCDGCSNR
jgi:hypothetical protein